MELEGGRGVTDVDIEKEQVKKWSKFLDLPMVLNYWSHCDLNFAQIYKKLKTQQKADYFKVLKWIATPDSKCSSMCCLVVVRWFLRLVGKEVFNIH